MIYGDKPLAFLAGFLAFGAVGVTLALMGAGVPFLPAGLAAAVAAGVVQWAALRRQPAPDRSAEHALQKRVDDHQTATAALRHDLRGVLSPALMVSDRLLNHADPAVQRAGQTVVRAVERATALLATHREALSDESKP